MPRPVDLTPPRREHFTRPRPQHYTIERRYRDLAARSGVGSVVYGIGERARGRVWCYEYSTFTVVMTKSSSSRGFSNNGFPYFDAPKSFAKTLWY